MFPAQTISAPTRRPEVLAEISDSIQKNVPGVVAGNLATSLVFVWAVWSGPHRLGLLAWLACQVGYSAISLWQARRIRARPASARNAARRLRAVTLGMGFAGSIWLVGLWLFWPLAVTELRWVAIIIANGNVAGALFAVAGWRPAFHAFQAMFAAGVIGALLLEGSTVSLTVAAISSMALLLYLRFGRLIHVTLVESLEGRHALAEVARDLDIQRNRAEQANLAKSRFLAAASHDLRQPVHALSLFVGALRQEPPGPGANRLVDRIESTVGSMGTLFNALLDISKLDAGMLGAQPRPCALRPLLERICNEERAVAAEKGLELRTRLDEVWVATDPVLFERIVRNLIVNALRYTGRGGVLVTLRRRGRDAVLRVVDTGIGIDPARQEEVFHEFVQLHNPERDRNKGLGLGLAIVRRLAELLDIRLALRSRPGRGSSFTLRLAAVEGTAQSASEALAEAAVGGPVAHAGHAGLVLVVDDDADIRVGMRSLLASWGYAVIDASGIADLLPQLRAVKQVPRLLISDYRLRGDETGHAVVQRLRHEYNEDIPAIIITGDTAPERLREAASGGHALLHKPLAPAQLRAAMARELSVAREDAPSGTS